mgnify:CR=1 FL=1|jgi:uncharacterized pyridoxamine 5'-phosphate oxidase family protein
MKEVYDFLIQCGVFFLATEENGQPRVRPFGAIVLFNNRLYTITSRKKAVSRQLAANPKVELCALDGENWLRIEAVAIEDNNTEAIRSMLDHYPNLKSLYSETDSNTQLFYFSNGIATFSSFVKPPRTITF